jgi:hypothetical protein
LDDSPESDYSTSTDSDSSSDSEDDDLEEGGDDGYEYEYYTEDNANKKGSKPVEAAVKPKTPAVSSYSSSYGSSSSHAAPSGVGSYYSSMGSSGYGAASVHAEPPTRNQSAYGASAASSGASKEEPSRTQRLYSGARTTSALTESVNQRQSSPPSSTLRTSRYSSPEPNVSSSYFTERRYSREDNTPGYTSKLKKRDDSDSFVSKYLAKSRSTAAGLVSNSSQGDSSGGLSNLGSTGGSSALDSVSATRKISGELQYPSGRSRYAALKERKARLERSKSSAMVGYGGGADDDDDNDDDHASEVLTPFTSRFGGELARSRSSHLLKNQGLTSAGASSNYSPTDGAGGNDENLSSWAKYLKNKYGNRAAASGLDPG